MHLHYYKATYVGNVMLRYTLKYTALIVIVRLVSIVFGGSLHYFTFFEMFFTLVCMLFKLLFIIIVEYFKLCSTTYVTVAVLY